MPTLKILIGVPGAGKSTWRKSQPEEIEVFSSDDYRKKLYGDLVQDKNNELFNILNKDTLDCLRSGKDAIYDATNISRRTRIHLYEQAKKAGAKVEAVHFLVPLQTALERNKQREGLAVVPDHVIEKMYKGLQIARKGVDCDDISVVGKMEPDWDSFDVPHNNPYHVESIKEHIAMVEAEGVTEKEKTVAKWHDTGKIDCLVQNDKDTDQAKYFREMNDGKFWQYSLHPNVSAQYYLSHIQDNLSDENLDNLEHILLHDTDLTDKVIRNYKLDENFIKFQERFRQIDRKGSIKSPYLNRYLEIMKENQSRRENSTSSQSNSVEVIKPSNRTYHVTDKGEVKICTAKKRSCKYGGTDSHFTNKEKAYQYADKINGG